VYLPQQGNQSPPDRLLAGPSDPLPNLSRRTPQLTVGIAADCGTDYAQRVINTVPASAGKVNIRHLRRPSPSRSAPLSRGNISSLFEYSQKFPPMTFARGPLVSQCLKRCADRIRHIPSHLEICTMTSDSSDRKSPPQRAPQTPLSHSDADLRTWIKQLTQQPSHTRLILLKNSDELPTLIARGEPFELNLRGDPDKPTENQSIRFSPVPGRDAHWQLTFPSGSPGPAVDLYGAEWIWTHFQPVSIDVVAVGPPVEKRPVLPLEPAARASLSQPPLSAKALTATFIEPPPVDRPAAQVPAGPSSVPRAQPKTWFKDGTTRAGGALGDGATGELWLEFPIDCQAEESCLAIAEVTRHGEPADPPRVIELKRLQSRRDWFRGHLDGCPRPTQGARVTVRALEAADLWRLDPVQGELKRLLKPQHFHVLSIQSHEGEEHLCVAANDRALQRRCTWFLALLTASEGGVA